MAGDLIYSEGEVADALFLIEMGTVDIVPKGKEIVFTTVGSGQSFGELAFFERGTRPASASAREPTHILQIPYERLSKVLSERPELRPHRLSKRVCVFRETPAHVWRST